MTENVTALVTAAGTIVAQGIMKSLRLASSAPDAPVRYKIITADASPQAAGLYRGDSGFLVPTADSPDYIESIVNLCRKEKAQVLFVGAEEELVPLSKSSRLIEDETGVRMMINSEDVIRAGSDKWTTFQVLKSKNLPCAESALPEDSERLIHEFGFPVIVKAREGHGSLHTYVVRDQAELQRTLAVISRVGWHPMVQEYLSEAGQEFTTGVVTDEEGANVLASITMRRTLKDGQTFKAFVDDHPEIRGWAERIALELGSAGPINIQARLSAGLPKTFEINPRFSASCPIRAVAGVNEPDILVRSWLFGERIRIETYQRLVCLRYLNEVYVPAQVYEQMASGGGLEAGRSFIPDYF